LIPDKLGWNLNRMPRIAVFTKNRTNPAYEAARLGADRVAAQARRQHRPLRARAADNVVEQIALIERAVAERPDAVVFTPVHQTAVNDAILTFDAAGIPLFNFVTRTTCRTTAVLRRLGRSRSGA
jgi:ribose transport system substrate-binding protein